MERLSPAAGHNAVAPIHERHRLEETVLYGVIQSELESFLARGCDRPLPRFVERELRGFLECGILAHGFVDAPGIPRDGVARPAEVRIRGVSASGSSGTPPDFPKHR